MAPERRRITGYGMTRLPTSIVLACALLAAAAAEISAAPAPKSIPNHQAELQQLRAQYPAVITIDEDGELLARFAFALRDQGFGLLRKDGGHNCAAAGVAVTFSCDWIIYQPTNQGCDVIGNSPDVDTPTPATVNWCDGEPNPGEFVKVTTDPRGAAPAPSPSPSPVPAPAPDLEARVHALEVQLADLVSQNSELRARVDALPPPQPVDVTATIAAVLARTQACGSTGRTLAHAHSLCVPLITK